MATKPDPMAQLAAEVVKSDDALRRRIAGFVSNVLDEAEHLLDSGAPKIRADLISKLIPHLVKQMAEQAEDEEIAKLRAEMESMMEEMRSGVAGATAPPQPSIPEDEAPTPTPEAPAGKKPPSRARARPRSTPSP